MLNLDKILQRKQEVMQAMTAAMKNDNQEELDNAMSQFAELVQEMTMAEARGLMEAADNSVLASRGVRRLTQAETKFYGMMIDAVKAGTMKQEINNISAAWPETILESVVEDIKANCPILDMVDFQNTGVLTKWLFNAAGVQLAKWGKILASDKQEIEGAIREIDLTHNKLMAYMCISMDLVEAGPQWVDRYVRALLTEALILALEKAVIDGTGKDEPIGMNRNLDSESNGVYAAKTDSAITDLSIETIGAIKAEIAKMEYTASDGTTKSYRYRNVDEIVMICNPADYHAYIKPAMMFLTANGYVNILDGVKVVQSQFVASKKLIFGLPKAYVLCVGMAKEGKIEVDDSVKFLDDQRAYKIKLRGDGQAKDNSAFQYRKFTSLKKASQLVSVDGTVTTKATT